MRVPNFDVVARQGHQGLHVGRVEGVVPRQYRGDLRSTHGQKVTVSGGVEPSYKGVRSSQFCHTPSSPKNSIPVSATETRRVMASSSSEAPPRIATVPLPCSWVQA